MGPARLTKSEAATRRSGHLVKDRSFPTVIVACGVRYACAFGVAGCLKLQRPSRRSALAREPSRFVTTVLQIRHYVAVRCHV